jgi:hypothetical protein
MWRQQIGERRGAEPPRPQLATARAVAVPS